VRRNRARVRGAVARPPGTFPRTSWLCAYFDAHEFTPYHRQWVVVAIDDAFFQRNDAIVRDSDMFGANLGAAARDVAHARTVLVLELRHPIVVIERIHFEAGDA